MKSEPTTSQQSSRDAQSSPTAPTTAAPDVGARVQMKRAVSGLDGFDAQAAALSPVAPVQAKGEAAGDVHAAAAQGIASGGGAMPHLGAIQQAFGRHDVSGVQAHTGDAATKATGAMGAEAYATGNHVAFGGGAPDLHTAAHEAAHVVQQRGGVSLAGGVGKSGDGYEQHADKVASAVVKGESAEGLLDQMAGGKGAGGGGATQKKDVQLKVADGAELQAVQEKLNKLGFDCGKADGVSGPKTRAAIKAFQAQKGLEPDGVVGAKTQAALDEAVAGGGAATATPGATGGAGAGAGATTTATPGAGAGATTTATPGAGAGAGTGPAGGAGDKETKAGDKDKGAPDAGSGQQGKDLDEKKKESKGKEHVKPSPEEVAKKEGEYASEGQAAFAAVKGLAGGRLGSGGDTVGGSVAGYPAWFGELQDWLVNSAEWTETHEKAQNVLYRYAMWKTECDLGYVPANVELFFRYIGKSSGNNVSAQKAGFKGASDIGGYTNGKNWCAQATTDATVKALKERGLKLRGGIEGWINNSPKQGKGSKFWCTACNGVELEPGDSVSYLGKNHNNTTGHRVTVLQNLGGGAFTHVSGNAGGGGSGSVRIGTSTRSDVPRGWYPEGGMTQANPKPKDDTVWVYSLQKTGDVFAELSKLDGVPATDPAYDALLKELRLERIK